MDAALIPSSNEIEIDCFLFAITLFHYATNVWELNFKTKCFSKKNRLDFDFNTLIFDI